MTIVDDLVWSVCIQSVSKCAPGIVIYSFTFNLLLDSECNWMFNPNVNKAGAITASSAWPFGT